MDYTVDPISPEGRAQIWEAIASNRLWQAKDIESAFSAYLMAKTVRESVIPPRPWSHWGRVE